ncbi:MAG: hypothetical protein QGI84_11240, partial [Dehalococcoidia bacterium]|nr:hypothetical protein [Dehalococcoidia bacterium]
MFAWLFSNEQIEQVFWARPISSVAMAVAFAAVVALTVFLYRRRQGLPAWVRMVVAVSRLVVLSLIVAVVFEPTVTVKRTRTVNRRLPVLI